MFTHRQFLLGVSTAALALALGYTSFAQQLDGSFGFALRPVAPATPPPPPPTKNPPQQPAPTPITLPSTGTPTLATGIYVDPTGQFTSINAGTNATASNPFFQPLGTNGRACVSCHRESQGWSITPAGVQTVFNQTNGTDPLFRPVDGANSPNAPVATFAERQAAYSELLTKGLIRIGLPVPSSAQFTLTGVQDPYNFASAAQLSLFRRPLPASNLPFLSTVMFDGRETIAGQSIYQDLIDQASDAVEIHEQGASSPSQSTLQSIVGFEGANLVAQTFDDNAGLLTANSGLGGPTALASQPFYIGINNEFGANPTGAAFNPNVFTIYNSWLSATSTPAQQSIARGQHIFDTRPFQITNVPGFNDVIGQTSFTGTCSSCHNTPNVGDHSNAAFIDLGLTDLAFRTPDLPLYQLKNKATGQIRVTSDPGRALITGQWSDIGKFKVPTLRDLASRAPYFHNGAAPNVNAVVGFYNARFNIGFTPQERADLANFLNSL